MRSPNIEGQITKFPRRRFLHLVAWCCRSAGRVSIANAQAYPTQARRSRAFSSSQACPETKGGPFRARSASCYVLAATVKTVADADMLCRLVSRPLRGALSTEPAFVMRLVAVRFECGRADCFSIRIVRCSRAVRSHVAIGAIEVGEFGGEFVAHRKFVGRKVPVGVRQAAALHSNVNGVGHTN